jgi:hypothetical protein
MLYLLDWLYRTQVNNTGSISYSSSRSYSCAGGICGHAYNSPVSNCYNTGNISASTSAGGICGESYGTISNCFAANATISGSSGNSVGRIVGNGGSISNCHALISMKINDWERGSMNADSKDGVDGEYVDFKNESWLTSILEWDFETVWTISGNSGWTVLKGMGEPTEIISLGIAPSTLDFRAGGETKSVTITSNVNWTANRGAAWITVTPASGSNNGAISITTETNTTTKQWTRTVTIAGGDMIQTVSITQAAYNIHPANMLTVSPATLDFTASSETKSVTITSNVSWAAEKNAAWITIDLSSGSNNGTISVTATANMGQASGRES